MTLASVKPDADARKKSDDYIDAAFEEHRQQEVRSANVVVKVRIIVNFFHFFSTLVQEDNTEPTDTSQSNPLNGIAPDPTVLQQEITEMQAQLSQVQRMMNESNIPAQSRMNAQMQASQLTSRIAQMQEVLQLTNQIINATSAAASAVSDPTGHNFGNNEYRQGWSNPYQVQQPAGADSAYQRLPINPRRRVQKRAADWETDGHDSKVPRFWE